MLQHTMFGPATGTPTPSGYQGTVIYETKGRAREYRELCCNLYRGCGHGCTYCYAVDTTFSSKAQFSRPQARTDIIAKLEKDAREYGRRGEQRQVMFCFTCDPYQPLDLELGLTRQAIETCHHYGLNICTLTKGGSRAVRDLDLFGPGDSFATTLTALSAADSLQWEPGAALPDDRMATLERFHANGVHTWVSLEPVIRPEWALEIIRQTHTFVDEYKIGPINHTEYGRDIDWRRFAYDAKDLLECLGCRYYFKRDLARHM